MIVKSSLENYVFNLSHCNLRQVADTFMQNSWVNFDAYNTDWKQAGYWVDGFGILHCEGLIKDGTLGSDAFNFGTSYTSYHAGYCINVNAVTAQEGAAVFTGGAIRINSATPSNNFNSLDSSHFPLHVDGWNTPSFSNSWVANSTTQYGGEYMKDPLGFVHFIGSFKDGTVGATVTTLPSGYRPSRTYRVPIFSFTGAIVIQYGYMTISTAGVVTFQSVSNNLVGFCDQTWTEANSPAEFKWKDIEASMFSNNWTHYDSAEPAQYMRDAHGLVHLRGLVKRSTGSVVSGETILTLPSGCIPAGHIMYPVEANGSYGAIDIRSDGTLNDRGATTNATLTSLDGIKFKYNWME